MGDMAVHDVPKPHHGISMREIGRQLDQMNATVFARQEHSDIGAFVVWNIVPNDVNDTFVRVPSLDFSEKLNGADTIDGGWFNEGRVEGVQVQSAVNVHAPTPRCCLDGGVCFDIPDERHPRSRRPRQQASYSVGFHKMR